MSDFHRTAAWGRLRNRLVAEARRLDLPCGICGAPIDWSRNGRHPLGPSADHIIGVSVAPGLALEPGNIRIVHRRCNKVPRSRDVIAQHRRQHGLDAPQVSRVAPQPAPGAQWQPQPWQHAYAAYMARQLGPEAITRHYLRNSRPWFADWTVADFDAGLVTADGRRG